MVVAVTQMQLGSEVINMLERDVCQRKIQEKLNLLLAKAEIQIGKPMWKFMVKRVLKTVRGICLGDEWTEIDSLKNKDWIELSDMFGNFDNHNPYFNHNPQYVLLDKFSITSPAILCSNEIVMKNGKVLSVDNISANLSGENEVYKIYSNTKYDDYTYYDESKNLVFELASKDVDKIIRFMRDFMDVLRDSKLTKYRNSSFYGDYLTLLICHILNKHIP